VFDIIKMNFSGLPLVDPLSGTSVILEVVVDKSDIRGQFGAEQVTIITKKGVQKVKLDELLLVPQGIWQPL
jgi:hypothetical protein